MVDTPCYPGNVGYLFLHECSGSSFAPTGIFALIQKMSMATFASLLYLFTFSTVMLEYEILMLHAYCFMNYLRLFSHKLFDKNVGRFKRSEIENLLRMYREIEVLVANFNGFHAGTLFLTYVLDCSSAFIISLYTITGLYKAMPISVLIQCGVLVFDVASAMRDFDGGFKSGVFIVSKKVIRRVRADKRLMTQKIIRKHITSWRTLKIYISSCNYFDEMTPLVMMHFNISNTISLLLLKM